MWASDNTISDLSCDSEFAVKRSRVHRNPVFILPADASSYAAFVQQGAKAERGVTRIAGAGSVWDSVPVGKDATIAVLSSIGIARQQPERGQGEA